MRIAMLGMFSGLGREYNPGSYLIGHKTFTELSKRLPGAQIDVFAVDSFSTRPGITVDNRHGLPLNLFSRREQAYILDEVLPRYDAVVVGGDIVWSAVIGPDANDVFFVDSPAFLASRKPKLIFNTVHTFHREEELERHAPKFRRACERADYVSVRSAALASRLAAVGISDSVRIVPDGVLAMVPGDFPATPRSASAKKQLGISLRRELIAETRDLVGSLDLDAWDVTFFLYSRQYDHAEVLAELKGEYGDRIRYLDTYPNPFDAFSRIGQFDTVILDTFHGLIGAIIFGVPFISVDTEPDSASRKDQLLASLGVDRERNVRLECRDPKASEILRQEVARLLAKPMPAIAGLEPARRAIDAHFDEIARIIEG